MNKITCILILLTASVNSSFGQWSKGFNARKNQLIQSLSKTVDKTKVIYSQNAMEVGMIYAALNNKDSSFWWLNESLDNCNSTNPDCEEIYDPNILGFYHFRNYTKSKEWLDFKRRILDNYRKSFTGSNINLALELIYAAGKDQSIRYYLLYDRSDTVKADAKQIGMANYALIKKIVMQHGFPGISVVGISGSEAAFLLIQHVDNDSTLQSRVLEHMKQLLKSHDINPENYAFLLDRTLINANKRQVYGTQFRNLSARILYPIDDSANVDKRRREIGLIPLSDYIKSYETF